MISRMIIKKEIGLRLGETCRYRETFLFRRKKVSRLSAAGKGSLANFISPFGAELSLSLSLSLLPSASEVVISQMQKMRDAPGR